MTQKDENVCKFDYHLELSLMSFFYLILVLYMTNTIFKNLRINRWQFARIEVFWFFFFVVEEVRITCIRTSDSFKFLVLES